MAAISMVGCAASQRTAAPTIADAWEERQHTPPKKPIHRDTFREKPPRQGEPGDVNARKIATVDGRPIARGEMLGLLLRSHGPSVLEQLIVLRRAEQLAAERGLVVLRADVDREYDRALRRLVEPAFAPGGDSFDRPAAECLLDTVLAERNISREEFMMGMRRNAYLRILVRADIDISEAQVREEYARAYSPRAQVRHIQVATLREADRLRGLLAAGESFDVLARRFSANTLSAKDGGLLEPFSRSDESVPALPRDTSFRLKPGQVSEVLRTGAWYNLIKLERLLPALADSFDEVRSELEEDLRERRSEKAMQELYEQIFEQADVHIHHPALREAFEAKHPDRRN